MTYKILDGARIPIKVFVDNLEEVEEEAQKQLVNTANLPWVLGLSAMPDVHWGNGATVGSVIAQKDALSPSVVGVDIGCGMCAVKTIFNSNHISNLKDLRHSIERDVPVGFSSNKQVTDRVFKSFQSIGLLSERGQKHQNKALLQLGTLGGGNHFIEICLDKEDSVWIVLHSGSRNIGKELAEHHISKAQGLMGELINKYPSLTETKIPKELAAFLVGTQEYDDYINDLNWCQKFAYENRLEMMQRVLKNLSFHILKEFNPNITTQVINCHHNYINSEDTEFGHALVTRKGAVSAKLGEYGIIPGSMGAKSFIVRGKGNPNSYCSCSHGAGRKMSRGQAKRTFTEQDLINQTIGVECRKDSGVIDEIPSAYKDIDKVMQNQSDLVEIIAELKQVICVKG
jgi:tRNA-splicing ligase RtcB